jgi:hypothetical protein
MKKIHHLWLMNGIKKNKRIFCVDKEVDKNYNDIENHSQ